MNPLKVRSGPNDWDFFLKWSNQVPGLVLATGEELATARQNKKNLKITLDQVLQIAAEILIAKGEMSKGELISSIHELITGNGSEVSLETIGNRFDAVSLGTTIKFLNDTYQLEIKEDKKDKRKKIYSLNEVADG